MVCCGLPVGRGVGHHHAPSIRLGDLDFSITLSLESHRHLRTSIIDSIVEDFAAVLLTVSFVIRFSALSHIVQLHGETFPVWTYLLLSVPNFHFPESYIMKKRLIEPAKDIYRDRFVAEYLLVHLIEN
jgi:hypothetical protein